MKRILTILLLALPVVAVAEDAKPAPVKPTVKDEPRFVPAVKDGKPQGINVFAVKPGSRFAVQGYKNGDRLTAVDGKSVNDTTEPAFREVVLEGTRGGKVELIRGGKPVTLTVEAVPADAKPAPAKPAGKDDPRFVPAMKDGKPQGIKIYAIKLGSRYDVQGYKNGDTLTAVDGQSVNVASTETVFREVVIDGTRGGKVDLIRAGKPMTLTVTVAK